MSKKESLEAAVKAKDDEFYTQLTDIEKELADLEKIKADKARSFNEIMIDYMKNHKHKNSDETYYDTFEKTIEEQYGSGFFASTVVDMSVEKKNRRRAGIQAKTKDENATE